MLYYQTKFGCKQTSSLEDTVEIVIYIVYKGPRCDLEIGDGDSEPVFLLDTLTHDGTPPYQVWLKTGKWFRRYPDKIRHMDRRTEGKTDRRMK